MRETGSKKQDKLIMGFLSLAATQSKQLAILNNLSRCLHNGDTSCSAGPSQLQLCLSSRVRISKGTAYGWLTDFSAFRGHKFSRHCQLYIWLKVYCRNRGIPFVDNFTAFSNSLQLFKTDDLHPSHRRLVPFRDKYWTDTPVRLSLLLVMDSKLRTTLDTASQLKLKKLSCMICW